MSSRTGTDPLPDPAAEERALRRAVDEGLVTPADVQEQARHVERWGPLLGALVRSGALSPALAERLLGSDARQRPAAAGSAAPEAGRPRYEIREQIGAGGMGAVYRAYDATLRRHVALKLLRSDDPDRIARFLREARAQARVDHENVCRIFEVGELDGKPYIAMQLIEGQPLFVSDGEASRPSAALAQMTAEQRARLMQTVAEAIHAAHREGLIHRDIKPSNIMIETADDGAAKPYVLDFGLAREAAAANLTSMGLAAGTPNFMAPEQARGEAGALDRRTDVYGLGATLYALLSGRPPFDGSSSLDVLVRVTEQDAPPLTGVAEDLATIVAKCLEKEPARRYESARALAEDLRRYLDGDPILARRSSLGYRLLKKARKHRKLVAAGGGVAVAFLGLGGWSLRAQLQARERTRLAGLFGQEVKAIESRIRIAHLAPEHDLEPEKAAVRQRLAAIEAQMARTGSAAAGPGHSALGRGHLALGDPETGLAHLRKAWQAGARERDVAYSLGLALSALYERERGAARRIPQARQREERIVRAQRQYRDPALAYLRQGRGLDAESADYVEALLAFHEGRYDEALARARAASSRVPWLYEARLLEARTYHEIGRAHQDRGEDAPADEAFARAEAAYRGALSVGRSAPSVLEGLCELAVLKMLRELHAGAAPGEPTLRESTAPCDRAVAVDRERVEGHAIKAAALQRIGEAELLQGGDPRPTLEPAAAAAEAALRVRPGESGILNALGAIHAIRGAYEMRRGVDPGASLRLSNRYYERDLAAHPTAVSSQTGLGSNYSALAQWEDRHGRDPRPMLDLAERWQRRAVAVAPGDAACSSLSAVSLGRAQWELAHGQDPGASLDRLAADAARALSFRPGGVMDRTHLGSGALLRAQHRAALGEDPGRELAQAVAHFDEALAADPGWSEALAGRAAVEWVRARFELERGRDPARSLAAGRAWAAKALARDGRHAAALRTAARLAIVDARRRSSRGASPEPPLLQALPGLARALEADALDVDALALAAELHWRLGRWRGRRGAGRADLERGLAAAERAVAINPGHAHALAVRGMLLLERGEGEAAARGRKSLEQALAVNRLLGGEYRAAAERGAAAARRLSRSAAGPGAADSR